MQPCNRIYYSTVHWRLSMFRAAYCSSSGALTVFAASEWELQFPLRLDYGQSLNAYVNQRLQIQLELLMMSGMPLKTCWTFNERWNNKFCYKVASCWLFLLSHTTMHGSINIKNIIAPLSSDYWLGSVDAWGFSQGWACQYPIRRNTWGIWQNCTDFFCRHLLEWFVVTQFAHMILLAHRLKMTLLAYGYTQVLICCCGIYRLIWAVWHLTGKIPWLWICAESYLTFAYCKY